MSQHEEAKSPAQAGLSAEYYVRHRPEVAKLLPRSYSRVIEIGCGAGWFRQNLRSGVEYWGVEPVADAAIEAGRRLNKVIVGTYSQFVGEIPDQYFDLVVCNDVIEHLPDHDWFLRSISGKMLPDGVLVASVPNVRFIANLYNLLIRKDWRYVSEGILDRTHLRFFTRTSLLRTFEANGFVVEACVGLNRFSAKNLREKLLLTFASTALGGDVQYLQFGVRARLATASRVSAKT